MWVFELTYTEDGEHHMCQLSSWLVFVCVWLIVLQTLFIVHYSARFIMHYSIFWMKSQHARIVAMFLWSLVQKPFICYRSLRDQVVCKQPLYTPLSAQSRSASRTQTSPQTSWPLLRVNPDCDPGSETHLLWNKATVFPWSVFPVQIVNLLALCFFVFFSCLDSLTEL